MNTNEAVDDPEAGNADRGSDAAFGERMRYRLQDMIDNPYSFLPGYEKRYETLSAYAQSLTPHQAYAMTMLLGQDSARLYPDMPETSELQFPRVNAVDVTAQSGWYYFAGTCFGEDGVEYGVLCMLFHYSLLPPPIARKFGLTDAENQIIDLQLGVAVGGGAFYQVDPVVTAGTSGHIRVSDKFQLAADNCSVESLTETLFPMRLQAHGTDLGQPQPVDIAIDFTFTSGRNYLLQGMDGAKPLVAGIGSRYYSVPGLVLDAAASSLTVDSQRIAIKGGKFWLDHQWCLAMSPSGSPRHEVMRAAANLNPQPELGWDFFAINFDGDYSMTLNSIHDQESLKFIRQTGETPPPAMTAPVVGKYMDACGTPFNISGQLKVTDWRKTQHSPNPEKYQSVGTWVPHGWEFTLQERVVPERLRKFRMEPIADEAQAFFFANGSQYVEAAVRLIDADEKMSGVAYAEAVAYVDNLPTILRLAGLPVNDENTALFTAAPPSPEMVALSLLYFLQPGAHAELDRLIKCGSFPPAPRPTNCGGEAAPKQVGGKTLELEELAGLLKRLFHERSFNAL
ncbi:MAG TPA: lipocalin-like domain-containing protein [Pyrinomonadaceae bacterium]|jgi:predicted secreted hydrolase